MRKRPELLPPRTIDWEMRPLSSAKTAIRTLDDGRLELTISHARLPGVTPAMLHWWFRTASETMEWKGKTCPRYHVWHPVDHISLTVVRRSPDGTVGPGSRFHIVEAFGGNPDFMVDQVVDVPRLDEGGISLEVRALGQPVMQLSHTFTPEGDGTRYDTRMLLGATGFLRPVAALMRRRRFPPEKARAWLKHNVEEVGNLPHFLPALYARAGGGEAR